MRNKTAPIDPNRMILGRFVARIYKLCNIRTMENKTKYQVRSFWLYLIMILGILSLNLGITGLIMDGIRFVYIPSILIGTIFLLQFRSFSQFGYIKISGEELTVNNGLHKTMVQLDDVNKITRKERSYILVLKNGKSIYIGLSFIRPEMRKNLVEKIEETQNK
jgi:uncharacterized membrane protein